MSLSKKKTPFFFKLNKQYKKFHIPIIYDMRLRFKYNLQLYESVYCFTLSAVLSVGTVYLVPYSFCIILYMRIRRIQYILVVANLKFEVVMAQRHSMSLSRHRLQVPFQLEEIIYFYYFSLVARQIALECSVI